MADSKLYRQLPSVDLLLGRVEIARLEERFGRDFLVSGVRAFVERLREAVGAGGVDENSLAKRVASAGEEISRLLETRSRFSLRHVINATGVVVHTNLGRAPLSLESAERVLHISSHYSALEYDIEAGRRGSRNSHFEDTLVRITGAEAATMVNNNAAAVLLALNTLSDGRETIVSRGELVEIGGSFRIPDVMSKSGALLREVGTTNRTRAADYDEAVGEQTALLLKVHSSNYRIVGFTEEVSLASMAEIGRRHRLPVMYDLGSGCLSDLRAHGLGDEPTVREALSDGADLVTFSGDKLLGGPQAGIIVGRKELIRKLDANPLKRALRVDKMTIAALELVLRDYMTDRSEQNIPVLRMITTPPEGVCARAEQLVEQIRQTAGDDARGLDVISGSSRVGGGSAPEMDLPTWLVSIAPMKCTPARFEQRLRSLTPPIIARVQNDRVLLDLRTVLDDEEKLLADAVAALLTRPDDRPAPG